MAVESRHWEQRMTSPHEASLLGRRTAEQHCWPRFSTALGDGWRAGTPVYTLSRNVSNQIIGVSDNQIFRRSVEGRSVDEQDTDPRGMINKLWNELIRDGRTGEVRVLRFAYALLQRSVAGIAFQPVPRFRLVLVDEEEAHRPFVPGAEEVPGLQEIPERSSSLGRGGGGEGEVHAALKAKLKHDPVAAIGERLTYLTEDLTDRLGDEISFITGDRVDLLMKDQEGRYVVIEVKTSYWSR